MNEVPYPDEFLIEKFPGLEKQILNKDFKILKVTSNDGREYPPIVRFPNLCIFAPNAPLIERIFNEVFMAYSFKDIVTKSYGLVGLDFAIKP